MPTRSRILSSSAPWEEIQLDPGIGIGELASVVPEREEYVPSLSIGLGGVLADRIRTLYWHAALRSDVVLNALQSIERPVRAGILIAFGEEKARKPSRSEQSQETALLLLLDGLPEGRAVIMDLREVAGVEVLGGIERMNPQLVALLASGPEEKKPVGPLLETLRRYATLSPRRLIMAPFPDIQYTALVPTPPLRADPGPCTVGVVARNAAGQQGVTLPHHGFSSTPKKGTPVTITHHDGSTTPGTIESADAVSDSCFAVVTSPFQPTGRALPTAPLRGQSPRLNQSAEFEGVASQASTVITGFDASLGINLPTNQVKLYTPLVTSGGDSGAALVDSAYLLGFASFRTSPVATPTWSAWMWAESVFSVHGLS